MHHLDLKLIFAALKIFNIQNLKYVRLELLMTVKEESEKVGLNATLKKKN
jgi:hypothetical protein